MAKWYGVIGFGETAEIRPGVWEETVSERQYYGDLTRNTRRLENNGQVNDDVTIANELSIVADPYARENFHAMRYASFMGAQWKITSVEVRYPRLILTLGGVFHGEQAETS